MRILYLGKGSAFHSTLCVGNVWGVAPFGFQNDISYICVNVTVEVMELIVKSNNEQSIAKILALAQKLNMSVVKKAGGVDKGKKEALKDRILNFKTKSPHQFGDAAEWERKEREDRSLPFS